MFRLLILTLVMITSAYGQSDRLGLAVASNQMAVKIPVAVASAMEASSTPQALPGVISYYFGRGRFEMYPTTQLGNELQPRVGDLMLQMGYANIIPNSGFQGVQGEALKQETEVQRVLPLYVVIPTISFETVTRKGNSISLNAIGGLVRPSNRVEREIVNQARNTNINTGGQKVKATFALRFYDQSGTQIMIEEACPQEFSVEEAGMLQAGLTFRTQTQSTSTLKPLAVKLMGAMTARLLGKGPCEH